MVEVAIAAIGAIQVIALAYIAFLGRKTNTAINGTNEALHARNVVLEVEAADTNRRSSP
jgi:hypothetical protein